MKLPELETVCYGIKQSNTEYEGKKYSSTTFYLPAELSESAAGKTLGSITVPYKCGDATEFEKFAHLQNSWPESGLKVIAQFELVSGKDGQGRDAGKLALTSIRPKPVTQPRAA